MNVYDFSYTSIEGNSVQMSEHKGKVLLIVNTASKCGFTPQYKGLQDMYDTYRVQGFEVIGFPCNQFMDQEPGSEEEIAEFCSVRYGVTFPLSQKVDVRGETATPLFKFLTAQKGFSGLGKSMKAKTLEVMLRARNGRGYADDQIKWNFTKFLVDRDGQVVGRYEPTVEPEAMAEAIRVLLAK